jgi:hypothetical protein
MERKILRQALQLLLCLTVIHSVRAQQTTTPTLDEILLRLQNNLDRYNKQVPDFFCTEHTTSSQIYGKTLQRTVTDSLFRITRTSTGTFTEQHEVQAINGTPAKGQNVGGPVILTGVFSGGLDPVSLNQKSCMTYTLEPIPPTHSNEPYIIHFNTLPNRHRQSDCLLQEESSGQVFIDPATMQVTRMELTAPHHGISFGETGVWNISIAYAPVSFVDQVFWMPATITSTASPTEVYTPTVYSFSARYSDYHKLEVTSRILSPQ